MYVVSILIFIVYLSSCVCVCVFLPENNALSLLVSVKSDDVDDDEGKKH